MDVSAQLVIGIDLTEHYKKDYKEEKVEKEIKPGVTQTVITTTKWERLGKLFFNPDTNDFYNWYESHGLECFYSPYGDPCILGMEIYDTGSHRNADKFYCPIDIKKLQDEEMWESMRKVALSCGLPPAVVQVYLVNNVSI